MMLCEPDNVLDLLGSPVLRGSQPTQSDPTLHNPLVDIIEQNAVGPAKASGDSGSIEQHKLADQIAVDKYLESKKASRAKGLGVKLFKISPGGTV